MPVSPKQRKREAIEIALEEALMQLAAGHWRDTENLLRDGLAKLLALQARPVNVAPTANGAPDRQRSLGLQRGLQLLALFDEKRPVWRLSDLADELGYSRSTTHRYAMSLVALGQLEQTTGHRYKRVS